jgi:hypothetical protein
VAGIVAGLLLRRRSSRWLTLRVIYRVGEDVGKWVGIALVGKYMGMR